jgi:hypothetical protein
MIVDIESIERKRAHISIYLYIYIYMVPVSSWEWLVPTHVETHFCQGLDEHQTSIGHHGFDVISDEKHNNITWHFCTPALHERDEWLRVLSRAATTITALGTHAIYIYICASSRIDPSHTPS